MTEWPRACLGDIATSRGFAIGPFGSRMKTDNYTPTGARVVRGQNITSNGRIEGDFVHISEEFADSLGSARLRRGDIALPHRGAIGRAALVMADDFVMSTSLMRVRVDGSKADLRFVSAYLASPDGEREILQFASTVGTPGIGQPLASLRKVTLPLPPLTEQRRIASVLGALDDLIETNREAIGQVRELSTTLYQKVAAETDSHFALGDVARVSHMKTKPAHGPIRYVDIAAMGDGSFEMPSAIDWSEAPTRARMKAAAGSTLWSTVRPNRRAHALLVEAPDNLVLSTGIAVLTPTGIGPAELFAAADQDGFVDQLVAKADGSAYPAVRPSAFAEVRIAALGPESSARFEQALWPLWLGAHAAMDDIERLTRTRDELLPLLMSGRVRVSEDLAVA